MMATPRSTLASLIAPIAIKRDIHRDDKQYR
jgi:hypothetical protein